MKRFKIWYALGGGFGGITEGDFEIIEAETLEQAEAEAYRLAMEEYDSYAGLHGLRDLDQIMKEDEIEDEDEAMQTYTEEAESWLDYKAEEITS